MPMAAAPVTDGPLSSAPLPATSIFSGPLPPGLAPAAVAQNRAEPAPAADSPSPVPVAAQTDIQDRLDRVNVLLDEVHRRITVNTSSLQTANLRIGELESGLSAADKRGAASEAALKTTQDNIAAVRGQLADANQRIGANAQDLEQVGGRVDTVEAGVKAAAGRLEGSEKQLAELGDRLARNEAVDTAVSATAREALERAQAAGQLADGRLIAEAVLSESIGFAPERTDLGESARLALLAFADKLKQANLGVYIGIQGYTDNSGRPDANLRLSRLRAEAVRDFLHEAAGLPLHLMNVAAYGPAHPVVDNKTKEGRVKNRRVVLVVLK